MAPLADDWSYAEWNAVVRARVEDPLVHRSSLRSFLHAACGPPLDDKTFGQYPGTVVGRLFGVPVFMGLLFFARVGVSIFGCQGPVVLLDKVCIHQTHKDIQRSEN
jgi:hypothetical protein